MSNIEPGSRTTNGSSSSRSKQEGEKQGFVKFRKHQPQPKQPVGPPPPEPSSSSPSLAIGWGGHGTGTAGARPALTRSCAASTAVARPFRPYHDSRVSNPHPKQDGKQEKEGGGTGSDWGGGIGGREGASSEGASKVMVQQLVEMPEEVHGGGDSRAAGSDGKTGQEDQRHDEGARGDDGFKGSWDHQKREPDGVHVRDGMSPRREGEDEEEAKEQGGKREPGQHLRQHETPEAEDRTAAAEGHGVTPGGSKAGEAAQRLQLLSEGGEYDDQDTQQQQSPTQRSQGDVEEAFDRDAQQTSPLPRPPRPELRRGDAPGQEQEQDRPQTHDSGVFLTQVSPQNYNNSEEGSYEYGDDLGPSSDDGLGEPPMAFLRDAEEGVKVGAKDTEDRQEGLRREQYELFSSRPRRSASDHPNREEGEEEEKQEDEEEQKERQEGEEEEEEEEAINSEKEGRERLQQQYQTHNQGLQQRSVPRVGSTTVDDNRNSDEEAVEQDHEMLPGHSPDEEEEHTEAEEEKRPRQGGRPQPQPQRSANAPQSPPPPPPLRGAKFNAFAAGDDEEPAGEGKNQGHDSGAAAGAPSGHSDRTGDGGAGAIVRGADAESRFSLATMSSSRKPLDKSGSEGGAAVAPNRAANSGHLVVGSRASDAEQQGIPANRNRGGMEMVDDGEGGDDEGFAEEVEGVKRKREESQAVLSRKVRDSFEKLTNSFVAASRTVRDVEAEQNKMIRDEDTIKRSLLDSGKRVREATRAMQTQLLAAFTGDGNDEGDLTDEPRGSKGRATAQGQRREGPATGSAPPPNDPPSRRPTAPSGARAAATATSQPPHDGGGGGVRGRGTHQPSRPQQDQQGVIPSVDVGDIHGSFGASSGHHGGNRPLSVRRLPVLPTITSGGRADQGKQKLGPNGGRAVDRGSCGASSKWSPPAVVGYGGLSRRGVEAGSALLPPRHAEGDATRGSGGSSMPNSLGSNGGASGLVGGGGGGRLSSSSSFSAKRPCRADFGRGRIAGDSSSDQRA